MNVNEIVLDEIELNISFLDEAVSCLLHTILFLRHPSKVTPEDQACILLAPLTFAKCSLRITDNDVRKAIGIVIGESIYLFMCR
jgi:hypothetical protein